MMKRAEIFSDEQLWLYLDGEVDAGLCERIEGALPVDPNLRARLEQLREDSAAISDLYGKLPSLSVNASERERLLLRVREEEGRLRRPARWPHAAAAALFIGLALGILWNWQNARGERIGRWVNIIGEARVVRAEGRSLKPLERDDVFYSGDRLRLADGAEARLSLRDGTLVEFAGPADFACRRWNGEQREFEMNYGHAQYDVARAPQRPFRVWVGEEPITVTGTRFTVVAER